MITLNVAEADNSEREHIVIPWAEPCRTCSAISAMRLRTTTGTTSSGVGGDRCVPPAVRRRACRLRRSAETPLSKGRRRLARPFHHRLCERASVGGFCRNLGALLSHGRYAEHRRAIRLAAAAETLDGRGSRGGGRFDPHEASVDRIIDAWLPLTFAVTPSTAAWGRRTSIPSCSPRR